MGEEYAELLYEVSSDSTGEVRQLASGAEKPKGALARAADIVDVATILESAVKVFDTELEAIQHAVEMLLPLLSSGVFSEVRKRQSMWRSDPFALLRTTTLYSLPDRVDNYRSDAEVFAITESGELWRAIRSESESRIVQQFGRGYKRVVTTPENASDLLTVLLTAYSAATGRVAKKRAELLSRAATAAKVLEL